MSLCELPGSLCHGRLIGLLLVCGMCITFQLAMADGAGAQAQNPGVPWPATDALGRALPLAQEVGSPRPDRFVGIFYFLWLNKDTVANGPDGGPYDVSKILAADPAAAQKTTSPPWGPIGTYHYWSEPLFGYYRSDDPWVIRRHARLLADAGIDTLIFDATNAITYRDTYMKLCEVFTEVRRSGGRTPQICFMVHTNAKQTAQRIYEELYKPGLYRDLWFQWQGKPLLLCAPDEASPEVRQFFTLRDAHWPFSMINTLYAWHWEATYPQPYGYTDNPAQPEQVNVSVAQNLRAADGAVTNMSNGDARGRSFHDGKMDTTPGAVNQGYNFGEQWQRALELHPPFVMVTGWNEWIAGRWGKADGPLTFVDQFNEEFSRDIELARGLHGDNYYYQLVANVRRFKGVPAVPVATPEKRIRIGSSFEQWRDVGPDFINPPGATVPRDFSGNGGTHYTNHTGRNNFVSMKVARDATNIYFYARTRDPIVPTRTPTGLWLLIDADQNPRTGWQGYDFIVNHTTLNGDSWLEKNTDGWHWEKVARVAYHCMGNELHLKIPRAALGLRSGRNLSFDFKWVDNLQSPGYVMDFYLSGDVAPAGRFNYRYKTN